MTALVIGASAAGLSTVEALRRKGYRDTITVLDAEPHLPYDRPPLSKQFLAGVWDFGRTRLRPDTMLSALDAEFVLGDSAVALDVERRTVHTAAGRELRADAIVVATGLRARVLPGLGELRGVHVLRTVDDATALRKGLVEASRVVVVGDGVLGAEIAATTRMLGLSVTMAGPQSAPLESQFGPMVAGLLAELHAAEGVELRLGTAVTGMTAVDGLVSGVRLEDGEVVPADLVVVALGAAPATEWLAGSGLELDNGLVCDSRCRAADGIYAAGDVARWHHAGLDSLLRLENRTNATEQAACVAANIVGEAQSYTPVPYFWTDQFATKIQAYGLPSAAAEVAVAEGHLENRRFVVHYRRSGEVVAVLGCNMPKQTRLHREHLVRAWAASGDPIENLSGEGFR
ncbi:NAD(P)/FAD-dependent oxidoreductase [Kribbella capetownensis]|uniref:NAD(P)/FAD-dependent oxidoreductase n=1 Tax=Kribbella capetownensis TaxID=1572659 RepID=A0A4R0JLM6_9ACTN|nr:FAD-dependent oxidoreductase [Kribbella capetownensis]TCC45728.1 NAD(P)/FAD-dependent oxidoreductase [Kribbella capetownensis]